jgi:hypothetical protein
MSPRVHFLSPGPGPAAGYYLWGGARAGFRANRRGGYPPSQPRKNQLGHQPLGPNIQLGMFGDPT